MYPTYTLDPYTRYNGEVTYLSYGRHDYTTYTTKYLTVDYDRYPGLFTTYGYIYRRDGNGGAAGGVVDGPTATAKVSEQTQAVPTATVDAARPTAPPTRPTAPPVRREGPHHHEQRNHGRPEKRDSAQLVEKRRHPQPVEKRDHAHRVEKRGHNERQEQRRDQHRAARSLRRAAQLEKRRRGGGSSSSGKAMSWAARLAPFPVLIAFSSLTLIWAIAQWCMRC